MLTSLDKSKISLGGSLVQPRARSFPRAVPRLLPLTSFCSRPNWLVGSLPFYYHFNKVVIPSFGKYLRLWNFLLLCHLQDYGNRKHRNIPLQDCVIVKEYIYLWKCVRPYWEVIYYSRYFDYDQTRCIAYIITGSSHLPHHLERPHFFQIHVFLILSIRRKYYFGFIKWLL